MKTFFFFSILNKNVFLMKTGGFQNGGSLGSVDGIVGGPDGG